MPHSLTHEDVFFRDGRMTKGYLIVYTRLCLLTFSLAMPVHPTYVPGPTVQLITNNQQAGQWTSTGLCIQKCNDYCIPTFKRHIWKNIMKQSIKPLAVLES